MNGNDEAPEPKGEGVPQADGEAEAGSAAPPEDESFEEAIEAAARRRERPPRDEAEAPTAEMVTAATAAADEACREILRLCALDVRVLSVAGDPVRVEVQGPDAGRVIGRRGMTLQALQYLVSRIVGQKVSRYVPIRVDVEGYRVRREGSLRALAQRVANDVVRDGRPFDLEPMNPEERRIVHLALAEDPDVETVSEGEGEDRRVVIRPVGASGRKSGRPISGNR